MTEEPWNKHTPGDPMPCKCAKSVVEAEMRGGEVDTAPLVYWDWGRMASSPDAEIIRWRFVERKGEDVFAADPTLAADTLRLLDEIGRLRGVLERIETASQYWADYNAAPDAVHYAHESTARLARAALAEGGPDDR